MADFAEVFLAQAEEGRAVEFGVSPDVVIGVRMKRFAILVTPGFLGLIPGFDVDGSGIPVFLFAAHIIAALEDQDLFAGRCQRISERASAGAGSNHDYVVVSVAVHVLLTFERCFQGWVLILIQLRVAATKNATFGIVVMIFGAEDAVLGAGQQKKFSGGPHSERGCREIDPESMEAVRGNRGAQI